MLEYSVETNVPVTKTPRCQQFSPENWSDRVDAEKCSRYIGHLQKVLPVVVEREGKASGH